LGRKDKVMQQCPLWIFLSLKRMYKSLNMTAIFKVRFVKIKYKGVDSLCIRKKITAHKHRHAYATHLVEENINLRYNQEAIGHRSTKTTEIYTRLSEENIQNMVSQ